MKVTCIMLMLFLLTMNDSFGQVKIKIDELSILNVKKSVYDIEGEIFTESDLITKRNVYPWVELRCTIQNNSEEVWKICLADSTLSENYKFEIEYEYKNKIYKMDVDYEMVQIDDITIKPHGMYNFTLISEDFFNTKIIKQKDDYTQDVLKIIPSIKLHYRILVIINNKIQHYQGVTDKIRSTSVSWSNFMEFHE